MPGELTFGDLDIGNYFITGSEIQIGIPIMRKVSETEYEDGILSRGSTERLDAVVTRIVAALDVRGLEPYSHRIGEGLRVNPEYLENIHKIGERFAPKANNLPPGTMQILHVTPVEYQKFRELVDKQMPGQTASEPEVDAILGRGIYARLAYVNTHI